jgi:hypothetical protein
MGFGKQKKKKEKERERENEWVPLVPCENANCLKKKVVCEWILALESLSS